MNAGPIVNSYWVVPGRLAAGEYPGAKHPEESRAKLAKLLSAGIRIFVDLTEAGELLPYADLLRQESGRIGIRSEWHRMPIPDVSIPTRAQMLRIQRTIADAMSRGDAVYVHCWGGVGRTGTVIGCFLVESGLSGADALSRLKQLWQGVEKRHRKPRTPETDEQEQFVLSWKPTGRLDVGGTLPVDKADRFRGCLLGGAVGDALGAPVEFMSFGWQRKRSPGAG